MRRDPPETTTGPSDDDDPYAHRGHGLDGDNDGYHKIIGVDGADLRLVQKSDHLDLHITKHKKRVRLTHGYGEIMQTLRGFRSVVAGFDVSRSDGYYVQPVARGEELLFSLAPGDYYIERADDGTRHLFWREPPPGDDVPTLEPEVAQLIERPKKRTRRPFVEPLPVPACEIDEWQQIVAYCQQFPSLLNAWETQFLENIKGQEWRLSPKQWECLQRTLLHVVNATQPSQMLAPKPAQPPTPPAPRRKPRRTRRPFIDPDAPAAPPRLTESQALATPTLSDERAAELRQRFSRKH